MSRSILGLFTRKVYSMALSPSVQVISKFSINIITTHNSENLCGHLRHPNLNNIFWSENKHNSRLKALVNTIMYFAIKTDFHYKHLTFFDSMWERQLGFVITFKVTTLDHDSLLSSLSSHLVARAKDVINIMDKIFISAC